MSHSIGCLVLAAGASIRLGQSKQLVRIDGQTLVRRAVETAVSSQLGPVVVVLGNRAREIRGELDELPVTFLSNEHWELGMGSSLQLGIQFFQALETVEAVLVTLCDQPKVTTQSLERLAEKFGLAPTSVVASSYAGTLGVPAIFPRAYFASILGLAPTAGAKRLFNDETIRMETLPLPEAELDIDTPEDLERFNKESETLY